VTATNVGRDAPARDASAAGRAASEQAAALRPGSLAWRRASDFRGFLLAGRALVLQVAHPTVAAGVREHSDYKTDPWGRLIRTLDFLNAVLYSDDAAGVAQRMRTMHRQIKGVAPDGSRYHALEPEAFTWVHATLVESIVAANQFFAKPLTPAEVERFHEQMSCVARLYGVRERDLPATWPGFLEYYDRMIDERLEDNDVVQGVLETITQPAKPLQSIPDPLWRAGVWPAARVLRVGTLGLIPERLRARFGVDWTAGDERLLRTIGAAARRADPVLPRSLRVFGPSYLRLRRRWGPPMGAGHVV
jgi:uncharacterized protein (DUF2236 family)